MRIDVREKEILKEAVLNFDHDAKVYLFGSRVDDTKKGGDIDILIVSKKIDKYSKRRVRRAFFENFGEQRLDLVVDDGDFSNPFTKSIIKNAVEL